jgi:aminocarboxymuconate-semialdehyde decarboxylase
VLKKKPTESLEKFYFDTITFDRTMLRQLVQRYGAAHVLLGTDYPYDMGMEHPVDFIDGVAGLSKKEKQQIQGANAARLLKIDYNKDSRRRKT